MPKIEEASLDEHRSKTLSRILTATEDILKTSGRRGLTMTAVSQRVGMARNSLYRYAPDTDRLCDMVLETHLPSWSQALTKALARAETPEEIILTWTTVNLTQASQHGHGWLMNLYSDRDDEEFRRSFLYGKSIPARRKEDNKHTFNQVMVEFHRTVNQPLIAAWQELRPDDPGTGLEVTRGIVQSGMRLMDSSESNDGHTDPARVSMIIGSISKAVKSVIHSLRQAPQGGVTGLEGTQILPPTALTDDSADGSRPLPQDHQTPVTQDSRKEREPCD